MYNSYAGIGSRTTPEEICSVLYDIARKLGEKGYTLRSGHAEGADWAFERGAASVQGSKAEIYLPWKSFNKNLPIVPWHTPISYHDRRAEDIAAKFHPKWQYLKRGAKLLHSRNVHQILGATLDNRVDFVVCWTPRGLGMGGTGQAIRIARHYNIPVVDLGDPDFSHIVDGESLINLLADIYDIML